MGDIVDIDIAATGRRGRGCVGAVSIRNIRRGDVRHRVVAAKKRRDPQNLQSAVHSRHRRLYVQRQLHSVLLLRILHHNRTDGSDILAHNHFQLHQRKDILQ